MGFEWAWAKLRLSKRQEFVIGGYTPSHLGLDAVLVGFYRDKELRFAGRVRAGFIPRTRRMVHEEIKHLDVPNYGEVPLAQADDRCGDRVHRVDPSDRKTVVLRYRLYLEERGLAPGTINIRMAAVRRLAYEAADSGLLSPELAAGIHRVKGVRKLGSRLGNWLTASEASAFWQLPDGRTLTGKPNRAMLAILLGCGLRGRELAELTFESLQRREQRWAIVDLVGKERHIRTVPVPNWVKETLDAWLAAAGISNGPLFRCVCRAGKLWGHGISEKTVWHVVKKAAMSLNIPRLAPHDLRRSCARLCHEAGGELEQIQFLLGHVSVQTTERYIGCNQHLRIAVNDRLGIEPG